jgi:hypothetical protein
LIELDDNQEDGNYSIDYWFTILKGAINEFNRCRSN